MKTVLLLLLLPFFPASAARPAADPADAYLGSWSGVMKQDSGQTFKVVVSIRRARKDIAASYGVSPMTIGTARAFSGTAYAVKKSSGNVYAVTLRLDAFKTIAVPATARVDEKGNLSVKSAMFAGEGRLNDKKDEVAVEYSSRSGAGKGTFVKKKVKKKPAPPSRR